MICTNRISGMPEVFTLCLEIVQTKSHLWDVNKVRIILLRVNAQPPPLLGCGVHLTNISCVEHEILQPASEQRAGKLAALVRGLFFCWKFYVRVFEFFGFCFRQNVFLFVGGLKKQERCCHESEQEACVQRLWCVSVADHFGCFCL